VLRHDLPKVMSMTGAIDLQCVYQLYSFLFFDSDV
jgi:hypothetical protein